MFYAGIDAARVQGQARVLANEPASKEPMQVQSPHIVGIAGGSCAGKSWLADQLQAHLGSKAARLTLDDFYRDQSHLSPARRAQLNFDRPQAIDWERLESVLSEFSSGRVASIPCYDFVTHGRILREKALDPAPVLIVEGLWLFRRPSVRKHFDLKIYIHSATELCMERRLRRDTIERGRTPEQVIEQWNRHTRPMFERFVAPQQRWSDIILNAPLKEADVLELLNRIECSFETRAVGI